MTNYIAKVAGKNGWYTWILLEGEDCHEIHGPYPTEREVRDTLWTSEEGGFVVVDKDFILQEGIARSTGMTTFEQKVFDHARQFLSDGTIALTPDILARIVDGLITMTNLANDSHEPADANKIIRQLETIFNIHVK